MNGSASALPLMSPISLLYSKDDASSEDGVFNSVDNEDSLTES